MVRLHTSAVSFLGENLVVCTTREMGWKAANVIHIQFSSVQFDLITQECRISSTEGFHAGPGPH